MKPTQAQVIKAVEAANVKLQPGKKVEIDKQKKATFGKKPIIFPDFFYGHPENRADFPSRLNGSDVPDIQYEQHPLGYSPVPHTGGFHGGPRYSDDGWYGWYAIELSRVMKERGEPIGIMMRQYNSPFPYGDDVDRRGQPDSLQLALDNIAQLDYVFMDLEGDVEMIEKNVREIHRMIREHPDPRINQARLGNYGNSANSRDEGMIWPDRRDLLTRWEEEGYNPVSMYLDCLDVSMPSTYPYETASVHCIDWIQNGIVAPNPRAAIFWQGLERLSAAKRHLPEGHMLIPWVGEYIYHSGAENLYHAPKPSETDNKALMMHFRMRGADCFYCFAQSFQRDYMDLAMEAWHSLDALFRLPIEKEIMNVETDKESGVQWSGVKVAGIEILLVSNLSDEPTQIGQHEIAPGEHRFVIGEKISEIPGA